MIFGCRVFFANFFNKMDKQLLAATRIQLLEKENEELKAIAQKKHDEAVEYYNRFEVLLISSRVQLLP